MAITESEAVTLTSKRIPDNRSESGHHCINVFLRRRQQVGSSDNEAHVEFLVLEKDVRPRSSIAAPLRSERKCLVQLRQERKGEICGVYDMIDMIALIRRFVKNTPYGLQ